MYPVPFFTHADEFKRFASEEYRAALKKKVVEPYFQFMMTTAVTDEVKVVQRAIRESFWPAVREELAGYDELRQLFEWTELVNEKYYEYEENDSDAALVVKGKTDHALLLKGTECCCLTLEDKAARDDMTSLPAATSCPPAIAQAFSQMRAALGVIKATTPLYVPEEYIGLLQNGVEWIVLSHKLVRGESFHRYSRATNVDDIVRALEHALCTAQIIAQQIRDPSKRPVRIVPTLHSIHEDDESSGGDGDDEEDEDEDPPPSYSRHSKASKPHLLPQNSTALNASKYGYTRSYEQHGGAEYYVLPLTESNLAAHFTAVK